MEHLFIIINPYRAWIMTLLLTGCLGILVYVCMDIFRFIHREMND